mmetsp:Transcript_7819/g.35456  ORF Transcript_7819/g.35456 Transcript_7819/m.35456 type:complete len:267 (-) Transcript_7819:402-1202(-)
MPPRPRGRRAARHRSRPRAPEGLHPQGRASRADAPVHHRGGRTARGRHHAGHTHPAARGHQPEGARGMCVGLRGARPRSGVATAERRFPAIRNPQSPIGKVPSRGRRRVEPRPGREPGSNRRERPLAAGPRQGDRVGDRRRRANHPERPRRRAGYPIRHPAWQLRVSGDDKRRRSRRGDGGDEGAGHAPDRAHAAREHVHGEAGGGREGQPRRGIGGGRRRRRRARPGLLSRRPRRRILGRRRSRSGRRASRLSALGSAPRRASRR